MVIALARLHRLRECKSLQWDIVTDKLEAEYSSVRIRQSFCPDPAIGANPSRVYVHQSLYLRQWDQRTSPTLSPGIDQGTFRGPYAEQTSVGPPWTMTYNADYVHIFYRIIDNANCFMNMCINDINNLIVFYTCLITLTDAMCTCIRTSIYIIAQWFLYLHYITLQHYNLETS